MPKFSLSVCAEFCSFSSFSCRFLYVKKPPSLGKAICILFFFSLFASLVESITFPKLLLLFCVSRISHLHLGALILFSLPSLCSFESSSSPRPIFIHIIDKTRNLSTIDHHCRIFQPLALSLLFRKSLRPNLLKWCH